MAVRYALGRWKHCLRFCDDGGIEIDNNAAERALRVVALGRKNFLFAGSDGGGEECRGDLQSARFGQAKRNRSRKLSTERVVPHRGSSDQADRGVAPVERRSKSRAPQPRGGINEDGATNVPTNNLPELPYIEETIENGGITIGIIPPLNECVAVAHEGRHTLAMLNVRKVNLWHSCCPVWISPSLGLRQTTFSPTRLTRCQNRSVPSSCILLTQDGQKRTLTTVPCRRASLPCGRLAHQNGRRFPQNIAKSLHRFRKNDDVYMPKAR